MRSHSRRTDTKQVWVDSRPGSGSVFHFTSTCFRREAPSALARLRDVCTGRRCLCLAETGSRVTNMYFANLTFLGLAVEVRDTLEPDETSGDPVARSYDLILITHGVSDRLEQNGQLESFVRAHPNARWLLSHVRASPPTADKLKYWSEANQPVCMPRPIRAERVLQAIVEQLTGPLSPPSTPKENPGHGQEVSKDSVVTFTSPTFSQSPPMNGKEGGGFTDVASTHPLGRILVVEDNPTNRKVAERVLARIGYTDVVMANDGKQGFQKTVEGHPDVVLMVRSES